MVKVINYFYKYKKKEQNHLNFLVIEILIDIDQQGVNT